MISKEVALAFPETTLDGRLTMAGILRKYWGDISKLWEASRTINGNINDYENRVLQIADSFKAFSDYTSDDIDSIISILETRGDYMPGTTDHYRHLVKLIIDCAYEGGEVLHSSLWTKVSKSAIEKMGGRRLVKSLTDDEEDRMWNWIKSKGASEFTGPEIGVILMFIFGLRNEEAGGTTWDSIRYDTNSNAVMLRVLMTLIGTSRELKTKGKTRNAHRELPSVYQVVNKLLADRKHYVKSQCDSNINLLPICCAPNDLSKPCTTQEINLAAKKLFNTLGINGNRWDCLIDNNEDAEAIIKIEKDRSRL